jgi:hypothetical protein
VCEAATLDEIKREQTAMPGGYVRRNGVVTKLRNELLPDIPEFRRGMVDRLVEHSKAEVYLTEDEMRAGRLKI